MGPTPPSASSSGGHSPEEQFRVVRRRNRVPLSCLPCRTRKGTPSCENCVKRGDTQSCVYASPSSRRRTQNNAAANATPDDMQNRIDRLEGLVLSLMHGGANVDAHSTEAPATSGNQIGAPSMTDSSDPRLDRDDEASMRDEIDEDSDVDDGLATSLGVLKVDADRGKSMYIGQEHWHTLLADITEVKSFFASRKKELEKSYEMVLSSKPAAARDSPIFLLSSPPATETELRAELPAKTAITTLVSRYFNSLDTAVSIVHGPTFQQQLRDHWQDPTKSSIMWVGLVYSMLCLAMLSYHKVGDEPPEWKGRSLELAAEYRLRTVQCLVVADYTKPVEYTVETMMLYLFGEWSSRWDADLGLWLIAALITRVAFRMGYHRDAEWFPSITPFQGEMRRRTWALIRMSDTMFSHQVSLPTMIYDHSTDTKLPHNLFDEEFGQDTKILPPARPPNEPTPIAYMIAKSKLTIEFGSILQAVTRVGKPVSYDEILVHDRKLRDIMDELPRISEFSLWSLPTTRIMCMLHRKHLLRARQNPRYAHSRRAAVEASLETLKSLRTIHYECQVVNGRLRSMTWFVQSCAKEALLPTMLVALELHHENQATVSTTRQNSQTMYFWTPEQRLEMLGLLEEIRDIWKAMKESSVEAYKASNILDIMIEKIKNPAPAATLPAAHAKTDHFRGFESAELQPEHSAAMTLGLLSTGLTPNYQSPGGTTYPPLETATGTGLTPDFSGDVMGGFNSGSTPFSMFTNLGSADMNIDENFDWNAFENYTQNANWVTEQTSFGLFDPNNQEAQQRGSSTSGSFFVNSNTPNSGKST
ncbi:fungal specific transcription factor domain-containing protein [Apiospora kogelbergensis]|uniref:fungal specific transcription factor domain-containing protein n=1 Tax=Apiospora kogelbergensis TaxID=1337665 RepID=UPI00312DF3ED